MMHTGTLIDSLVETVEKVQGPTTEPCPFCVEGHSPQNFGAKCSFCHGSMLLGVGETSEIMEREWQESR